LAKTPRKRRGSFEEAQVAFEGAALGIDAIFEAYGYRCAFTGEDLKREIAIDPSGALLHLTMLETRANEMVPACTDAIYAFERGHLSIGVEFNFLVDLARIDPELLGRLNPNGKLALPTVEALYPPSAVLKAHRDEFAEGLIR
jgi:hypothetical protein